MIPASFIPMIAKMILGKKILPKIQEAVAEHIAKTFKLTNLVNYMELPNDADKRIDKLEAQIEMLAKDSHPPKEFDDRISKLEEKIGK